MLTVKQAVKKFPPFCAAGSSIAVLKRNLQLSQFWEKELTTVPILKELNTF